MRTYFFVLLLATLISYVLTRWLSRAGADRGWFRRSSDAAKGAGVPRLGGVAVFLSANITLGLLLLWNNQVADRLTLQLRDGLGLLLAAGTLFLVGLYDDLRGMRPWTKLLIQLAAASALYYIGFRIELLSNPFAQGSIQLGWFSFPVTMLWLVGISNAFNLIDGLDGLAGGVGLFASLSLFLLALLNQHAFVAVISLAVAGGLVGFLPHNFNPARIYLGDCGSLSVGLILAALAISASQKGPVLITVAIPLVIFGLPLLDVSITTFRRLLSGQPLFSRDNEHLHHRLLRFGFSERSAVLILYAIAALFALSSLLLLNTRSTLSPIIALLCGVLAWLVVRQMQYAEFAELDTHLRLAFGHQHRMLRNQIRMRKAANLMRSAASVPELWDLAGDLFEALEFDFASCELELPPPDSHCLLLWSRNRDQASPDSATSAETAGSPLDRGEHLWALTIPLYANGTFIGRVRLSRSLGRGPLLFRVSALIEFVAVTLRERIVAALEIERLAKEGEQRLSEGKEEVSALGASS